MKKYYMLAGYIVSVYKDKTLSLICGDVSYDNEVNDCKKYGFTIPRNYSLLKLSSKLEISIAFYNFSNGCFLIKATNRGDAYYIANMIRTFYSIFYGWTPLSDLTCFYLQELRKVPQPQWSKEELFKELILSGSLTERIEFDDVISGHGVFKESLPQLKDFILLNYNDIDLCESMNHLLESRFLFDGYMTGSYYGSHYKFEREQKPAWIMEKRYYESKYRYETAYVAAFKGIERFFRVNDFKKHEIKGMFSNINYKNISYDTEYTRYYEIFSGAKEKVTYGEILEHFLKLRNIVAAHGNRIPSNKYIIIEDHILEIQFFLEELINRAVSITEY